MTSPSITVDIWSDIACPWCYIGKRKFEEGLAALPDGAADDVVVTYHSFELSPDTPVDFEGSAVDFLSAHKGLPAQQVEQMLGHVAEVAGSVGLTYDFAAVRQTKTLLAHEALHHAKAHGKQLELVERLFAAYFEQGRHVGRVDELVGLAAEVGLDAGDVRRALESGEHTGAVQADIDQARAYGIQGVPFFVIDGRYGISGAQSAETFTAALAQVRAERTTAGVS
ncbi:DsbA family oxidoreductase [Georgenia wangjunii]|uniref:DsbA family oxidoreductase n=1 Tax=Georgenia wangjunii TaxID=3117730 RepID=UPI002F26AA58